jgi:hypothetical protein
MIARPIVKKRGFVYRLQFDTVAVGTPGTMQEKTLQMENDSVFILSRILMRHNDSSDAGNFPAGLTSNNVPLYLGITDLQSGESLFIGNRVAAAGIPEDMLAANALLGAAGWPITTFLPHILSTPLEFAPNSSLLVKLFVYGETVPAVSFSFIGTKHYLR